MFDRSGELPSKAEAKAEYEYVNVVNVDVNVNRNRNVSVKRWQLCSEWGWSEDNDNRPEAKQTKNPRLETPSTSTSKYTAIQYKTKSLLQSKPQPD